jgi:hypothetical protein
MGLVSSPAFPSNVAPAPAKKTKKEKSAAPVEAVIEPLAPEECCAQGCEDCVFVQTEELPE